MEYNSQYKQDYIIDEILNKKENGFFIDIGAHDGITLSNSFFFETQRNWDGICFEPMPEVFNKLKTNRSCTVINAAVYTSNTDSVNFTRCHGYSEMLSGISDFRDDKHKERTDYEIKEFSGSVQEIKVKGVKLIDILNEKSISEIDYLSIDIEGGEFEVLNSIDFTKLNLTCLTVENNYNDNKIENLLSSYGFVLVLKYKSDDFYINSNYYTQNKTRIEQVIAPLKIEQKAFENKKKQAKNTSPSFTKRVLSKINRVLKK